MHSVWFLSLSLVMLMAGQVVAQAQRAPDDKSAQSATAESPRRRAFEFLDKDRNGLLNRDEFLGGTLGKAAKAKLDEFKKLDADESGALDFQEFQKLEPLRATPERIAKEFKRLDKDADGKLTLDELLAGRSRQNQPQARNNFVRFDADRDGFLTAEEFQRRGKGVKLTADQEFKLYIVWCVTVRRKAKSGIRAGMSSDAADRESDQPDVTPTTGSASPELPPLTAESLDEFHVE